MKKIDLKNKKTRIILVIAICLILIGTSFALWYLTLAQTDSNKIATSCFNITLTNEQNAINLQRAYPILDEEGKELTPYTFTITNNCDTYASYDVNLELLETVLEEKRLDAQYVKVMLNEEEPVLLSTKNSDITPTLDNAYKAYELTTGYLEANESVTYNLRLWIDGDVTLEDPVEGRSISSKITVTANYIDHIPTDYEKCVAEYGSDSIQCGIVAELDTTGACPTVNDDGTVNVTDIEDTLSLVCSAPDDYGTSYYYRGNVTNNYVKFAGFYWRILRINGDGSIRMIYAGDADVIDGLENKAEVLANGYNDGDTDYTQIGTSYYNEYWKKDNVQESTNSRIYYDNAGVGYMYGNRDGIVEGSAQSNIYTQSTTEIRYYADSYTYNPDTGGFTLENPVGYTGAEITGDLVGKYTMNSTSSTSSSQYVLKVTSVTAGSAEATIGYSRVTYGTTSKESAQENINDSTIKEAVDNWYASNILSTKYETYVNDTLFCNDRSVEDYGVTNYSNLAYGTENTTYRAYSDNENRVTLYCSQQSDRFTVNDEVTGNGALSYPAGLLTVDEALLAGGNSSNNSGYYLYSGNFYWTMSPNYFYDIYAYVRLVNATGSLEYNYYTYNSFGVRPVINLKPNSLKSGDGSALNPFLVG